MFFYIFISPSFAACPSFKVFPQLPKQLRCNFDDQCQNVTCCIDAVFIQRKLTINFNFDLCSKQLYVAFERMETNFKLDVNTYGFQQTLEAFGFMKIR